MAASRIHKIASIFDRISGLLETGVIKEIDKPIWFDVYKHHPPKYNPVFHRQPLNIEIKPILYEEDTLRAEIHKLRRGHVFDLSDNYGKSATNLCQEIMKTGVPLKEAIQKLNERKVTHPKTSQGSTIFDDLKDIGDVE